MQQLQALMMTQHQAESGGMMIHEGSTDLFDLVKLFDDEEEQQQQQVHHHHHQVCVESPEQETGLFPTPMAPSRPYNGNNSNGNNNYQSSSQQQLSSSHQNSAVFSPTPQHSCDVAEQIQSLTDFLQNNNVYTQQNFFQTAANQNQAGNSVSTAMIDALFQLTSQSNNNSKLNSSSAGQVFSDNNNLQNAFSGVASNAPFQSITQNNVTSLPFTLANLPYMFMPQESTQAAAPTTTTTTSANDSSPKNCFDAQQQQGAVNNNGNTALQANRPEDVNLTPLRALSAYNFFFRDERECILNDKEHDWTTTKQEKLLLEHWSRDRTKKRRHRKTHGKIDFTSLSKLISARWKELPEERKEFYREVAARDWARYQEELTQFNSNSRISTACPEQYVYQVVG